MRTILIILFCFVSTLIAQDKEQEKEAKKLTQAFLTFTTETKLNNETVSKKIEALKVLRRNKVQDIKVFKEIFRIQRSTDNYHDFTKQNIDKLAELALTYFKDFAPIDDAELVKEAISNYLTTSNPSEAFTLLDYFEKQKEDAKLALMNSNADLLITLKHLLKEKSYKYAKKYIRILGLTKNTRNGFGKVLVDIISGDIGENNLELFQEAASILAHYKNARAYDILRLKLYGEDEETSLLAMDAIAHYRTKQARATLELFYKKNKDKLSIKHKIAALNAFAFVGGEPVKYIIEALDDPALRETALKRIYYFKLPILDENYLWYQDRTDLYTYVTQADLKLALTKIIELAKEKDLKDSEFKLILDVLEIHSHYSAYNHISLVGFESERKISQLIQQAYRELLQNYNFVTRLTALYAYEHKNIDSAKNYKEIQNLLKGKRDLSYWRKYQDRLKKILNFLELDLNKGRDCQKKKSTFDRSLIDKLKEISK